MASAAVQARHMPRSPTGPKSSRFLLLASVCVVVAALYFAQDVLIPLALAMLLEFLAAAGRQPAGAMEARPRAVGAHRGRCVFPAVWRAGLRRRDAGLRSGQQHRSVQGKHRHQGGETAPAESGDGKAPKGRQRSAAADGRAGESGGDTIHAADRTRPTQPDRQRSRARGQNETRVAPEIVQTESRDVRQAATASTQWTRENPLLVAVAEAKPSPLQTLRRIPRYSRSARWERRASWSSSSSSCCSSAKTCATA